MSDGPADPFGPGLPDVPRYDGIAGRLQEVWQRPIKPMLPVLRETADKPIGQFTMQELLAWGVVLGYMFTSIMVAELMVANLVRVAIRGR